MAVGRRIDIVREGTEPQAIAAPQGVVAWLLQRLTAGLLVVFLGAHLWILHFAVVGERITFEGVLQRMQSPVYFALDVLLLGAVIYHALNGTRAVILDFGISQGLARAMNWAFVVIGLVTFVFGVNALFPFFTGAPLFYR